MHERVQQAEERGTLTSRTWRAQRGVSRRQISRWECTYLRVHSRAVASYRGLSVLYRCAISGTSGSSGFGSVSMEQMDSKTT
jgi:hypothetical protein